MTFCFGGASDWHISDLLAAYHNGTLDPDDRMRVRTHLNECASCRAESNDWAAIATASRSTWGTGVASPAVSAAPPFSRFKSGSSRFQTPKLFEQSGGQVMSAPLATAPLPRQSQRQRYAAQAGLIAIVLAVLVGVIGIRQPGNRSDDPTSIPAVALSSDSTPESDSQGDPAPGIANSVTANDTPACTVAPGDLSRLDLTGPTTTESVITPPDTSHSEGPATNMDWREIPTGSPASDEQVAGITATVQQFVSCANAMEPERASALFTDDYWRRRHQVGADIAESNPRGYVGLSGQDAEAPLKMPSVEEAAVLPDGRVGAKLQPELGYGHSYQYFIFLEQDGDWLIDEAMHVSQRDVIQLEVNDEGFSQPTIYAADGKTELELTNTGTRSHSIVIPELNIRIEVAPGETGNSTIVYEEATLPFYSDMPGDSGEGFSGEVVIDFPATPVSTPPASPVASPTTGELPPTDARYIVPVLAATIEVIAPAYYYPDTVALIANRDAQLTLNNTGLADGNFRIDALGIDVDIPSGESVTITVNAVPGVYAFYSDLEYTAINGMYGTLIVFEPGTIMIGD